jgi:hypothetical protein
LQCLSLLHFYWLDRDFIRAPLAYAVVEARGRLIRSRAEATPPQLNDRL